MTKPTLPCFDVSGFRFDVAARLVVEAVDGAVLGHARMLGATFLVDHAVRQFLAQRTRIQLLEAWRQETLAGRTAEQQEVGRLVAEGHFRIRRRAHQAVIVAADGQLHFQVFHDRHQQLGIHGLDGTAGIFQCGIARRQQNLDGIDVLRESYSLRGANQNRPPWPAHRPAAGTARPRRNRRSASGSSCRAGSRHGTWSIRSIAWPLPSGSGQRPPTD